MTNTPINYKTDTGRHRHNLCNHCTTCGEPLLASYCPEHEPSYLVYLAGKLTRLLWKIRRILSFKRFEQL